MERGEGAEEEEDIDDPRQSIHSGGPTSGNSKLISDDTLESAMIRDLPGSMDLRMWECLMAR